MKNEFGQITSYKVGNGVAGEMDYHPETHLLKLQKATSGGNIIQDFTYTYDDFRNLAARTENKYAAPLVETFRYDNLNRLEYISMNGIESKIGFDAYGRMRDKMADGRCVFHDAEYGDAVNGDRQRPHAIRYAELNPSYGVSNAQQFDITYTMFDKVKTLTQDRDYLEINYGYDHERISMEKRVYGRQPVSKTYVGNCEYVTKNGATTVLTYLSGPLGVFAVHESAGDVYKGDDDGDGKGGYSKLHYIFKDHLGSWTTITDEKGSIEREQSFDAWGKMRDPYTWREFPSGGTRPQGPMFDRGFTGHEHLFEFGLINMNGRMYDPVMSTFLSVDNYVQSPENSQNFNRYAYCLNNPLCYIDPDGEIAWFVPIIVGAVAGTITGGIRGAVSEDMNFFDGAWRGLISGTVGGALSIIGGAGMSFGWNLALGTFEGAATGALDAGLWNTDVAKGAMWGAITGAVLTTLTSENLSNAFKGKGFKTNANVFEDFKAGKYAVKEGSTWQQEALDYFGFEGKYVPNRAKGGKYVEGNDYFGSTNPQSGDISFGKLSFESYDNLRGTYEKELFHRTKVLNGEDLNLLNEEGLEMMRFFPEEAEGFLHAGYNNGLYLKSCTKYFNQANFYWMNVYGEPIRGTHLYDFIFKIPRRW